MHKPNIVNDDIIYDVIMTLQGDYPSHSLPRPSTQRKRVGVTCLL